MLQEMIKTLDAREATILRYRFGLDGGPEKTLEEVYKSLERIGFPRPAKTARQTPN